MNIARFPEIAKAVGAQRGGKYLKRIPKAGGGYRYVYHETGKEGVNIHEKHEKNEETRQALDRVHHFLNSDGVNKYKSKMEKLVGDVREGRAHISYFSFQRKRTGIDGVVNALEKLKAKGVHGADKLHARIGGMDDNIIERAHRASHEWHKEDVAGARRERRKELKEKRKKEKGGE